jgi:DNA polymerase (family 10)
MDNVEIARALEEVADLLELQGANPFRIRAYRNAVRTIEVQTTPLAHRLEAGSPLTDLPGIGKEMASHIRALVTTGTLAYRDELLTEVPRSLLELMRLPGVGPKRALRLWKEIQVGTVDELEAAARSGRIAKLSGFGPKTQEKILAGIQDHRQRSDRMLLSEAERHLEPLLRYLGEEPAVLRLDVAGSYRRRRETVGDIDLLALATDAAPVMRRFLAYPQLATVTMAGDTRATGALGAGLQVDLRVVPPACYGAALIYFTGSKEHNVKLRRRGVERGLRISEYGVYRLPPGSAAGDDAETAGVRVAGKDEAEVYGAVDLAWIPPELREDHGEIEAAARGPLPPLIELGDLRGDLQMHSTWSDGRNTLEEMVTACEARGYAYMAITDHSKALAMTNGLDAVRLRQQWREITAVRRRHPGIRLLRSLEIDILTDGSLDLEDEMIADLDLVVVSIHSRFDLPEAEQTARILRALDHPRVQILAHPTGRKINRRRPIRADMPRILERAAERGVAVELNAQPDRLDLRDTHLVLARELGCKIVISSDAHSTSDLDFLRHGVAQARRARLEPQQVVNTRPVDDFLRVIARGAMA